MAPSPTTQAGSQPPEFGLLRRRQDSRGYPGPIRLDTEGLPAFPSIPSQPSQSGPPDQTFYDRRSSSHYTSSPPFPGGNGAGNSSPYSFDPALRSFGVSSSPLGPRRRPSGRAGAGADAKRARIEPTITEPSVTLNLMGIRTELNKGVKDVHNFIADRFASLETERKAVGERALVEFRTAMDGRVDPRTFEVVSQGIKNVSETNETLAHKYNLDYVRRITTRFDHIRDALNLLLADIDELGSMVVKRGDSTRLTDLIPDEMPDVPRKTVQFIPYILKNGYEFDYGKISEFIVCPAP